jgi:hypothetical protein
LQSSRLLGPAMLVERTLNRRRGQPRVRGEQGRSCPFGCGSWPWATMWHFDCMWVKGLVKRMCSGRSMHLHSM